MWAFIYSRIIGHTKHPFKIGDYTNMTLNSKAHDYSKFLNFWWLAEFVVYFFFLLELIWDGNIISIHIFNNRNIDWFLVSTKVFGTSTFFWPLNILREYKLLIGDILSQGEIQLSQVWVKEKYHSSFFTSSLVQA